MMPALQSATALPMPVIAQPGSSPTMSFDAVMIDAAKFVSPVPTPVQDVMKTAALPSTPVETPVPVSIMPATATLEDAVPELTTPVNRPDNRPPIEAHIGRMRRPVAPAVEVDPALEVATPLVADHEPAKDLPTCEVMKAASVPEVMIAAPTIAVPAQAIVEPARLPGAHEPTRRTDTAVRTVRNAAPSAPAPVAAAPVAIDTSAPSFPAIAAPVTPAIPDAVRHQTAAATDATIINGAAIAGSSPGSEPSPTETSAPDTEQATQTSPVSNPVHRPVPELAPLNSPATVTPTNSTPQIFHELDLARDLAWIGNLAQEIVAAADDRDSLHFRLMPRSMGQLDIGLSNSAEGLRIEMTATTDKAQQIIAAEQPRLIEELRQSGIRTVGTDLASGEQSRSQRGHQPSRNDQPFGAFSAADQPSKPGARPNGRFA